MRTTTVIATAAATTTLAVGVALGAQAALRPSTATEPADGALAATLTQMREEERMARDLYAALAEIHDGARPMSMITNSEQKHFDAMGTLLERYDVTDPSAHKAAGTYALPEIQSLYDSWYAEGKVSLDAAYQVGIELETRDIADLEKAIAVAPTDVDRVLNNLLQASQHHLSAYQSAAAGTLPEEGGAGMGQGMGHGQGQGQGQGQGKGQGMGGNGPRMSGKGHDAGQSGDQDCPMQDN